MVFWFQGDISCLYLIIHPAGVECPSVRYFMSEIPNFASFFFLNYRNSRADLQLPAPYKQKDPNTLSSHSDTIFLIISNDSTGP